MAAGTLGLAPQLLPWHQAGVDFLLAQDDVPPEFSLCHTAPAMQATAPRSAPRRPERSVPSSPQDAGHAAAPRVAPATGQAENAPRRPLPQRSAPAQGHAQGYAQPEAQSHTQASTAPRPMPPAAAPALTLPPEHWPRPWRERLKATKPAPVLWTYWTLGEDLCGTPNVQRRDLLRRLLGDLGHPAGTHTFWPAALPPASATDPVDAALLEAHTQAFWAGVDMLKARALVVMGSPAVKALDLPPRLRPFQQTRHNGRLVVVLRDVDFLAEETQHYDAVREFLRQALAPFGR